MAGCRLRYAAFCILSLFFYLPAFTVSSSAGDSRQAPEIPMTASNSPGDSLALPSVFTVPADSIKSFAPKDVKPKKAMFHSLLIPGGGQLDNGSRKKAFLFIAAELVCLGGVIYETYLLGGANLSSFDKEFISTDRNTFIIVWLGAKLFGMVDAYVDAQMKHFNVEDVTPPGMGNQQRKD